MRWSSTSRASYLTEVGEQRQFRLPDGSTIELNTQSRVQVEFTPTSREVRLIDGEAFFSIRHDRRRPFRVRIGQSVIEDIGTRFNIRVLPAGVKVSVTEGQVRVMRAEDAPQQVGQAWATEFDRKAEVAADYAPFELARHEEAMIPLNSQGRRPSVSILTPQQIDSLVSWRRGMLTFMGQTLAEWVAEMNRYNSIHIVVVDPRIADMRFGGTFVATEPLSFVDSLEHFGVTSDVASVIREQTGTIHLTGSRGAPVVSAR